MCFITGDGYSPPNFNIFQRNFVPISPNCKGCLKFVGKYFKHNWSDFITGFVYVENVEKLTKTLIFRHFSYRQPYKFSDKILLDDNMTLYWKKNRSKNTCYRRRIFLSEASNSSFSNCPCCSSFEFSYAVLSILKTIKFQSFRKKVQHDIYAASQ